MTIFQLFIITILIRLGNYLKTLFIYSEQLGVWRYSLLISSCQFLLFQDYLSEPTLAHEYSHLRNQSQQSEKAKHDCLTTTIYLSTCCTYIIWILISRLKHRNCSCIHKSPNNPNSSHMYHCIMARQKLKTLHTHCLTSFTNAPYLSSRHAHQSDPDFICHYFSSPRPSRAGDARNEGSRGAGCGKAK